MASLVLGAVGGFMFGPVGWMVGSLLGNLLFPGKQEGPRLQNLKLQGSSYGQMIPIPYGTVRVAGQVVWQTDLKEHKHVTGGKGGPQVTTYTYTVSFAVKLSKSVKGLSRIWANGTIIYDTTAASTVDNSKVPITFYPGVESANPDPTMEAVLGVGNVPAFRDDCAVVFTDWDVGEYGNTIPQLSFEIFTSASGIPWRVSTWTVDSEAGNPYIISADINNGYVRVGIWEQLGPSGQWSIKRYQIDGTFVDQSTPQILLGPSVGIALTITPCANNPDIGYGARGGGGMGLGTSCWFSAGGTIDSVAPAIGSDYHDAVCSGYPPLYSAVNESVYAFGGSSVPSWIARYPAPSGVPVNAPDVYATLSPSDGAYGMGLGDDGSVYVARMGPGVASANRKLFKFDADLNLIQTWLPADLPADFLDSPNLEYGFTVHDNVLGFVAGVGSPNSGYAVAYDLTTSPLTYLGRTSSSLALIPQEQMTPLDLSGLCVVPDGIVSLNPPPGPVTLASIVADISDRCGNAARDVSALTDLVDGFLITTQTDGRSDIDPLRAAYFFDAVESSGVVKFVKRGGAVAVTIPDNDLAAQQRGETPPPLAEIKRAQEVDLPKSVNVKYMNVAAAYQEGNQLAARQVSQSQATSSVELAIVMSDQKARQIANVLLFSTWMERNAFTFRTSRKYDYLEPTDIVIVRGYQMRITRKMETLAGVLEFEALATLPSIYLAAPAGNPTSGYSPPPAKPPIIQTQALLLDIPLITDTDDANGFYAAMAGLTAGTWNGATLYESRDGGANYFNVETDAVADTFGTTAGILGDFGGGDIFDELNSVSVVIGVGGGTLASATADAVINGANIALLGDEVVQFKNAVLTAPSTYLLSGFLRGRQGTEFAMSTHYSGERFVLLPVNDVAAPFSDLTLPWLYKPVSAGDTLPNTVAQTFTNNGARLRCYSPVQLGGGRDASGNVFLQWNRRTRIGGLWLNYVDALLSETTEAYYVYIYTNNTYSSVVRTINVTPAAFSNPSQPSIEYTTAMQTVDFGGLANPVYWGVAQIGTLGPGIAAKAQT